MSDETTYLRTQAKRCRGMAEHASSEEGEAILRFVARDFDEAAERLENINVRRVLSIHLGHQVMAVMTAGVMTARGTSQDHALQ